MAKRKLVFIGNGMASMNGIEYIKENSQNAIPSRSLEKRSTLPTIE